MAIIYSYPTVLPSADDLILGTDVNQADKPTKNFTIQSIVDIVAGGASGLGAVLTINNSAQGIGGNNQSAINFLNIQGTGTATFSTFTDGTMQIFNGIGTNFTKITSVDFAGNLTGIVKAGSSVEGAVTGFTQPFTTSNLTLATTAFVQQEITGQDLDFSGTTGTGSVDLDNQVFSIVGTAANIETSAAGAVLTLKLTDDVTIADDLTVTDKLTVNGTTALNVIAGGIVINESGFANTFRVKGDGNDNLISTNVGTADADNKVAIGKLTATVGTRLDVSGLILGSSITSTGLLTTGSIDNNGYYQDSTNSKGTDGQLLSSSDTGTTTTWIDNPNPEQYTWTISSDSNTPLAVVTGTTIDFAGGNNITTQWAAPAAPATIGTLTIDANGLAKIGTAASNQVTYWSTSDTISGSGTFRWIPGSGVATSGLSVDTQIRTAKYTGATIIGGVLTNATATWEGAVMSGFNSITTVIDTNANNNNGFFGPLRASSTSTNYTAGVADEAVKLTVAGTVSPGNDIVPYPSFSLSTNLVVAVGGTTIVFDPTPVLGQIPIIGQAITGTGVEADTVITNVQLDTPATNQMTLTVQAQASGIAVGTALSFATVMPIYTSGGNIVVPSYLPDSIATSKLLTGLTTGTSTPILNTDSILVGLQNLQAQISGIPQGIVYAGTWDANANTTNGLSNSPALASSVGTTGEFYIVNVAGATNLNGITDWSVGDWAIFVEAGVTDVWSKIDNTSEITGGPGTDTNMTMWTGAQSIGTSVITQVGAAAAVKTITLGSDANLSVTGNTTLGSGITDTTLIAGPLTGNALATLGAGLNLTGGIDVGGTYNYGTAGQVLTNQAGTPSATQNLIWTTQTVGTLTGITAGAGIITALNADADNVTVSVDYLGTDNVILEATQITAGAAIPSSAEIMFNDPSNAVANTVLYAPISSLPFVPAVSGTQYTLPMFATTSTLGDSIITQNAGGTAATINGWLTISNHIYMDNRAIKEISELSFGANAYITSPSNFLVRFNQTSVDIPSGNLTVGTIDNATTDTDKFLVSDSGVIKYRTGAEVLSDIGAAPATGGAYLPLAGGTLTGALTGTDATFSGNVFLADDKSLTLGTGVDSKIFFDNAASVLADATVIQSIPTSGNGTILLQSYNVKMRDQLGTSNMFHATRYGVTLYYDGDVKFTTTSSGINLNGFGSGTKTGTPTYNLEVDSSGNVIETPSTNPGGGGGTFHGDQAITTTSPAQKAFTLTRAATGTLIFDVWFTSETNLNSSVAKKYTVAHAYNATPVYNKIIDTGEFPNPFPYGTDTGFTVSFVNATALSVECYIIATGSIYSTQNIGYTIQVGYDSTNALTFTPAS
jgi:hypothetical protein